MLVLEALIDAVLLSAVIFSEDAAQVEISRIKIKASFVFNNLTILNINVLGKKLCVSFLCKLNAAVDVDEFVICQIQTVQGVLPYAIQHARKYDQESFGPGGKICAPTMTR